MQIQNIKIQNTKCKYICKYKISSKKLILRPLEYWLKKLPVRKRDFGIILITAHSLSSVDRDGSLRRQEKQKYFSKPNYKRL